MRAKLLIFLGILILAVGLVGMALIATGRLSDRAAEATAHMSAMKTTSHNAILTGLAFSGLCAAGWVEDSSTTTTAGISVVDPSGMFSTVGVSGATVGVAGVTVGRITEIHGILIVARLLEQRS